MSTTKRFEISPSTARFCEEHGLLRENQSEYTDEEIGRMSLVHTLLKAGFSDRKLARYLNLLDAGAQGCPERKRLLCQQRAALLDAIHEKERSLLELDYLIREQESK